eukprot:572347-Pleurochrysis_carterae.AAC.1
MAVDKRVRTCRAFALIGKDEAAEIKKSGVPKGLVNYGERRLEKRKWSAAAAAGRARQGGVGKAEVIEDV